jgi:hypothetical protein
MTMASERYAAGDDTSKAVIAYAPNEESTNLSSLAASAGPWGTKIGAGSGRLPETVAHAASSLNPDIDSQSRGSWSGSQDGGHPVCPPNVAADAEPAEPRAMLERTLT